MSLSLYKKKRNFNKTPEPEGRKSALKNKLVFVVQKHDATRLHYDSFGNGWRIKKLGCSQKLLPRPFCERIDHDGRRSSL
jgi:hypothetical protein